MCSLWVACILENYNIEMYTCTANNIISMVMFDISVDRLMNAAPEFLSWIIIKDLHRNQKMQCGCIDRRSAREMKIFLNKIDPWKKETTRFSVHSISKAKLNASVPQINYQLMFDLSAIYLLDGSVDLWGIAWNTKRIRECVVRTPYSVFGFLLSVVLFLFVFNLFDLSTNNELYVICQFNAYNFSLFPFSIRTVVF